MDTAAQTTVQNGRNPITIQLPEALWQAAKLWADREGDVSAVLIRALETYLARTHEEQVDRQPGKYAALVKSLSTPIADLHLSARVAARLHALQIRYIYELVETSSGELRATRNFGEKSFREVRDKLTAMGLSLGMTLDERSYAAAVTAALVANMRAA